MKKIIKKILCCSLLAVCLICVALAGACAGGGDGGAKLSLNFSQATVEIGDKFTLIAKQEDGTVLSGVQFTSSNENIVTVNEKGAVVAEKAGSAQITVSKDGASATCEVSVIQGNTFPTLLFNSVGNGEETYTIYDDTSLDLSSKILFKGNYYDDLTQTITLSNTSAGTVQNGVFVANELAQGEEYAETKVMITAEWRGFNTKLLYKEVNLKIIRRSSDVAYFNVNGGMFLEDVELYSVASLGDQSYDVEESFTYSLFVNGQQQANLENVSCTVYSIDSEYDVAKVENNKIVALGGGRAEVVLKYEVDGKVLANLITVVNVTIPFVNSDTVVSNVSAVDGIDASNTLFGGEKIRRAVQNMGTTGENELTVENGIAFGLQTISTAMTTTSVTFFTATRGYTATVQGYTKILTKPEDLLSIDTNAVPTRKIDGYFFVANDIDATNFEGIRLTTGDAGDNATGFIGTFDGNGKTITIGTTRRYGLFGATGNGAVIKNVGFMIKQMNHGGWNHHRNFNLIGQMHHGSTLRNVAINYTPDKTVTEATNILAYKLWERVTLRDVYIYMDEKVDARDFNTGGANVHDGHWQAGYIAGFMMRGCKDMGLIRNVQVVSPNLLAAGSVNGMYAENTPDNVFNSLPVDNYGQAPSKCPGLFRYETVAELKGAVSGGKVGNWLINNDGTFTWVD